MNISHKANLMLKFNTKRKWNISQKWNLILKLITKQKWRTTKKWNLKLKTKWRIISKKGKLFSILTMNSSKLQKQNRSH
jgi:hypothetical protein